MSQGRRSSFVVRVAEDRRGQISGVIERVATGAKEAFTDVETIGRVIIRMLRAERAGPRAGSGPSSARGEKPCLGERPQGGSVQTGAPD
jgi:hypothetical protein